MARPRKEGMDYFPHDVHAANDKKVEALRMLYGNDGYAFYFILLENIYQESNFELDISDAETIQILCRKTELTKEKFDQILETALKRDCFDRESYEERGVLTSNGIKKRAEVVVKKRVKMQDSYKESVSDVVSDIVSEAETHTETPKVKESKSKDNSKDNNKDNNKDSDTSSIESSSSPKKTRKKKESVPKIEFAEFVHLTSVEHTNLLEKFGADQTTRMIEILDNYKGSSGKKYDSDYRAILNWVVKRYDEETSRGGNGGKYERRAGGTKKENPFAFLDVNKPRTSRVVEDDPTIF